MSSKWYGVTCDECNRKTDHNELAEGVRAECMLKTDYNWLAHALDILTRRYVKEEGATRFLSCPRSSDTLVLSILAERRRAVWRR